MPNDPIQRTVVVTGAAGGIGSAVVASFLDGGARVIAMDSSAEALQALALSMGGRNGQLVTMAADVSLPQAWEDVAAAVGQEPEHAVVLVNNAGISPKRDGKKIQGDDMPLEEWLRVLEVNLTGPFLGIRALAPQMKRVGSGRVINMASVAARDGGHVAGVHYAATKTGLLGLTRGFARELAPYGITVNAVAPGRIAAGMSVVVAADVNQEYLGRIPVGRLGTAEDIAAAIQYLAHPDNGFVTGVTLDVNGGSFMG